MEYTMSEKDILMHLESERLKSFENWPFDESCKCTPARVQTNIYFGLYHRPKAQPQLAKAGFYSCGTAKEPDAVQCFMCFKELDGWEPDDDPWEEHKNHSSSCVFLQLTQPIETMTCEQVLKLDMTRNKNKAKKIFEKALAEFTDTLSSVREEMRKLAF